jgi:hypothetical protein
MALLRVCRQIYSEAASLPMKLNTFSLDADGHYSTRSALAQLKPYQRRQIKNIQIEKLELDDISQINAQSVGGMIWPGISTLPHIEEVHILVFSKKSGNPLPNKTITIGKPSIPSNREIQVTVESLDKSFEEYYGW